MKFIQCSLSSIVSLFFLTTLSAQNNAIKSADELVQEGLKRYEVESAIIKYELTGNIIGTQEIYFDKWGWREAKFTKKNIAYAGHSSKENSMELLDGLALATVDLDRKTGNRMVNPMLEELTGNSEKKSLATVGEEMLRAMGGEEVGEEVFLGRNCTVYHVDQISSKIWVWKGLVLKMDMNMMGIAMNLAAQSIDTDPNIPADIFELPAEVTIQEVEVLMPKAEK